MSNKTVALHSQTDNQYFLKGFNKSEIYLLVELTGGKIINEKQRIPLNLSLVIDRSGSMQGEKLEYAKKAVEFVIQNLSITDYLSIIQYDDKIEVVSASGQVKNKEALKQKVSQITARNNTNLSGGMLEGYNQVNASKKGGQVNRVLLLSDGLANEGITEPTKLQDIAQKKFRDDGIGLSTFGVGADFNENLMTNLAEFGGANYYFIDNPDKIPSIFANELQGLLAVVAQNNNLEIVFPAEYLKVANVFGFPYITQNGKIFVKFNDIFAEETKTILVKFDIIKQLDNEIVIESLLSFDDVNVTMNKITEIVKSTIKPTLEESSFKLGMNLKVMESAAFFIANFMYEQALSEMDNRNFENAKAILRETKTYLSTQSTILNNPKKLEDKLKIINDYDIQIDEMKEMTVRDYVVKQKASKSISYDMRKGKV